MKFCAICGEQVQSDNTKLIRHCQHHHKDLETASCFNEGYLRYGCQPSNPKYSNLQEHLADPKTPLILNPGFSLAKGGRPPKLK